MSDISDRMDKAALAVLRTHEKKIAFKIRGEDSHNTVMIFSGYSALPERQHDEFTKAMAVLTANAVGPVTMQPQSNGDLLILPSKKHTDLGGLAGYLADKDIRFQGVDGWKSQEISLA